ncbi:MAG: hypothetical protein ACW98F_04855 [Candidatus Hodarchaeales archaeon]
MALQNSNYVSTAQLNELKIHLRLINSSCEDVVTTKWQHIQHMQIDLDLDPSMSIKELAQLYYKFEDMIDVFKLKSYTFRQLEKLLVELETVKDMLGIPRDTPLQQIVFQLTSYDISSLGVGNDSILEMIMKYY